MFTLGNKKPADDTNGNEPGTTSRTLSRKQSFKQALSARAGILFKGGQRRTESHISSGSPSPDQQYQQRQQTSGQTSPAHRSPTPAQENSVDVAGPRFYGSGHQEGEDNVRKAGEASVYKGGLVSHVLLHSVPHI